MPATIEVIEGQTVISVGENTAEAIAAANTAIDAMNSTLAGSHYFSSKAAGEAATATGGFFSYPDGAGGLIYAERTVGGSIVVAEAPTRSIIEAAESATATSAASAEASKVAAQDAASSALAALSDTNAALSDTNAAKADAEAARDDAIAAVAAGTRPYYPGARANVPQGATGTGAITGGTGGTNGTFALAFTGGNFAVNPTGTFTVSGGAVTAITITGPGLYIGGAISASTLSFAASAGLTGAAASLVTGYLVTAGEYYYTDHASDPAQVALFQNVANVATEVDPSVDWLNIARAEAAAQSIDDRVQIIQVPGGGVALTNQDGDAFAVFRPDGTVANKTITGLQTQIDTIIDDGAQATFDKSDIVEANADSTYLAVGKYLLINAYGQSLSTGTLASAVLSTTAMAGVKMFTGGPRDRDAGFSSASVVDHVEHVTGTAGETVLAGMAQAIRHLLLVEDGIDISATHTLLMNTSGEPGQSALALAPGSTPHNRLEAAITAGKARAGATAFDVLAMPFLQGEQDYTDGTAPATWAARVEAIRSDTQAHVQTTTGLSRGLPMVIYQMAQHVAKSTDPDLALKSVDMCSENAAIGFACPMHFFDYVDTAHLTARSYLWAGLYFGLAVKRWCFDGYKPKPLVPSAAVWDATGVTLTFPTTGKLLFDTAQVTDPGNFGFSLETADGVTKYPVEVYILGRNKVRVQRAAGVAVPVGTACRYAFYTDNPGAGAALTGRTTGARGCLRDNRGEVIAIPTTSGETFPLHQWVAIFEEIKP